MRFIADRLSAIAPAETMEMAARAAKLRRLGIDVVSLSQGEPDFDTPEHIQQAAVRAIHDGRTRYTESAGVLSLREAITHKMQQDHGLAFDPGEVSVSAGAKQVIFNAFFATLNPGDEVLVPAPCWVSYPEIVKLTGGTPRVLDCPRAAGFKLTPAQLAQAITPRTKWLMLNSPSNPTGALYSRAELAALAEVLRAHPQVWLLSDDIYEKLVYGAEPFATMLEVAPDLRERTLVVNGVSKVYCMTGWRIGYGVGPRELIGAMNLVQGQSTSNANSIAQYAAVAALTGDQGCVAQFRTAFHARRDFMVDALNAIPGLSVDAPPGAFYVFVCCQALLARRLQTDRDLVQHFLDVGKVALVSGSGFLHPGYFRASYAAGLDQLADAAGRIRSAVLALEGNA